MTTEVRLRELCAINNNISAECNKMMQYLQIIKDKSDQAITFLNSLNTAIFLRRYSATYEYLNKLYIKLVDQNCSFELFFLELDEPDASDLISNYTSTKDLTSESVFNLHKTFHNTQEPCSSSSNAYHPSNLLQHTTAVDALNDRFEAIKSKLSSVKGSNESLDNMNVHAKEFMPKQNTSSTSSRDVVIESSSASSICDNAQPVSLKITAANLNVLNQENVAQHNLLSSSTKVNSKANKTVKNAKGKHSGKHRKVSAEEKVKIVEIPSNNEEKKDVAEKSKGERTVLDVTDILKKLTEKKKQNEMKFAVPIPDLRPQVVKKDDTSNSAVSITSTEHSAKNTKSNISGQSHRKPQPHYNKNKTNAVSDNLLQNIEIERGLIPKEGDLCYISTIDSPSSFYIHILRDEISLIDSLSAQISEICASLKMFYNKKEAKKFIKCYCVCYINSHSAWCRVEITNWLMEHDQMVEVRLIDYGLTAKVPLRNIREANQFLFKLPQMADKCELAWVKPIDGSETWSNESIEHFRKIIIDKDRYFTISYVSEYNDRLIIDLQNNDIDSVAGLMITDEKAMNSEDLEDNKWTNEFMRQQIIKSQGFSQAELDQIEEDRLESLMFDDEDDDEVSDPNLAVSHYKPRDESKICRLFLARGYCFKGKNCSFSHTPLNPDGWTTDREAVYYDAFNHLQLPQVGADITVKIVNIVDLKTFYVVVKKLPECSNLIGMPVHNIRSLVKLMNEENHKHLEVIPALGEIILVRYDDNWQRGRVIEFIEFANKIELEVLLVDFGVIQTYNMKHCRKIQEKHLHVPFQVVQCILCNVSVKENMTDEENEMGCDYLEIHVENKKLKAKVVLSTFIFRYSAGFLNAHLYNENGQDIGEELIMAGIVNRNQIINVTEQGLLVE